MSTGLTLPAVYLGIYVYRPDPFRSRPIHSLASVVDDDIEAQKVYFGQLSILEQVQFLIGSNAQQAVSELSVCVVVGVSRAERRARGWIYEYVSS